MHTEDSNDDALIMAAGNGDQQAFNRLVQRHSPKLYAIVFRYVRSREDADEIVQEAFWKTWKMAPKWQPGRAKFSTWLYQVAVNSSIDVLRKGKRRPEITLDNFSDMEGPDRSADAVIEGSQSLALMQQAIDRLPDKQRLAILLSTHEEKSNIEIASIMGKSEGAVEQLLVRARRSLRQTYREIL